LRALHGLLLLLLLVMVDAAMAQPFGLNRGASPLEVGFTGWILAKQAEFYRMMSGLIRAAKADGSAAYTLLGISFLYGVFHAAGPGHGKAVISSYLVANNETWRRGIVLSFASAILQALTAIAIVGVVAALLGATAKVMGNTVRVIEIVSYALILVIGLRLLWVKGKAFLRALRLNEGPHAHDHTHHEHGHGHHHHHDHDRDHDHDASAWSHGHAPEPSELAGAHWLRRGLTAIVAVGLRPCSGAIIVLVFALAQGLFWIGVASTFVMGLGTAITVAAIATLAVAARELAGRLAKAKPGVGAIMLRGLETAAALVIVLFGAALLTGYLASERLMGV
jgi:ABC-type nickel/cobalt efflux system permease component RcnA